MSERGWNEYCATCLRVIIRFPRCSADTAFPDGGGFLVTYGPWFNCDDFEEPMNLVSASEFVRMRRVNGNEFLR